MGNLPAILLKPRHPCVVGIFNKIRSLPSLYRFDLFEIAAVRALASSLSEKVDIFETFGIVYFHSSRTKGSALDRAGRI